jgi:sulfite exporter TauE/SafE
MSVPSAPGGIELAAFLVVGALGGAHCLGMCGPLVTVYADRLGRGRGTSAFELRQHALFNLGRTASYALLGALAGLAGSLFFRAAAVAALGNAVRAAVGVLVGTAVVGTGVRYLLGKRGTSLSFPGVGRASAAFGRARSTLEGFVDGPGIVGLGAVHGLLPCPILYPAYLYAFARGSPAFGALALAALGAGTFPTLFVYGTALGALGERTRNRLHRALGAAFLAMGVLLVLHGLGAAGLPVPHVGLPAGSLPAG